MNIEVSLVIKSPCTCTARVEDRLPWECEVKDSRAAEYWEGCRRSIEAGQSAEEYLRPHLVWEKTGKGRSLPPNIHEVLYELSRNDRDSSIVRFAQDYGPLLDGRNIVPLAEIRNALGFYRLLVDIWNAVRRSDEAGVKRLLLSEQNNVETFISQFDFASLEEDREPAKRGRQESRLYVIDGRPIMFSEYGSVVHDRGLYFLQLPFPIPQNGLLEVARNAVTANLRRYLRSIRSFTEIDPLARKITISPPGIMSSALFSFWQGMCKQTPAERMRARRQAGVTVKDQALGMFRMRKLSGTISQEEYARVKDYAGRIYRPEMDREQLQKKLAAYFNRYLKKKEE